MLEFDPVAHIYTYKGRRVPSVTTALKDANLLNFDHIPAEIREHALNRGSVVHKVTELHDNKTLDVSSVADDVFGYYEAWKAFYKACVRGILDVEKCMVSVKYHYAGTPDRRLILLSSNGKVTVVDIKTAVDFFPANDIQLAAYLNLYKENGLDCNDRMTVLLDKSGTFKTIRPKHSQVHDFNVFLSALSICNWRKENYA